MGSITPTTPYWNVNVASSLQTPDCPDFLVTISDKDRRIIGTPNHEYTILSWPAVQKIIATNRIDIFQRIPYELRRYRAFVWKIEHEHGSILQFILTKRLHWEVPLKPEGKAFECAADLKILWNDWPYGIDERIAHLVVWTKFDLEDDPETGFLTEKAGNEIDDFVRKTLSPRLDKDRYIWFKNWRSLKSVHAVEHFHIMIFDPPEDFVAELTNGDVPQCRLSE